MVFFVKQSRSTSLLPIIGLSLTLCLALSSVLAAGTYYPDCELRVVSDNHLLLKYQPQYSDDFSTVSGLALYPVGDGEAWGREIVLALTPGGDLDYAVNFSRAGSATMSAAEHYLPDNMPLVVKGEPFMARGHRLVRLVIFPQRREGDHLAAYKDFVIDISLTASNQAAENAARVSRLDSVLAECVINSDQFYRFGTAPVKRVTRKEATGLFDGSHQWYKIAVNQSGVTRITGAALAAAGLDLTSLRSDSLRLYYAGGVNPPDSLNLPEPELYPISINVEDGGDDYFNSGDQILFYAQGPNRYEIDRYDFKYVKNNYNDKNYYWLTTGAVDGDTLLEWTYGGSAIDPNPDEVVSVTRQPVRFEQENIIKVDGDGRIRNYYDWFWSNNAENTVSVNLPSLSVGDSIDIRLGAVTSYNSTAMWLNGTPLNKVKITDSYFEFWDNSGAAVPGLNTLTIDIYHVSSYYLDFLDINYPMQIHIPGTQLSFNSQGHSGILHYEMTGFTPSNYVLNITDPARVKMITGVNIEGDTARFQDIATSARITSYITYAPATLLNPVAIEKSDPGNLRQDLTQYDCIVVAPRQFLEALQEYVDYRYAADGARVKLVAVEDIYDNFGFGMLSPMAIRNYLKFAYENYDAPAPYAVLLVGDGHYDFLDNLGRHTRSYIPPFIWPEEYSVGDDNYVYFGQLSWLDSDSSYILESDRGWDMMAARWPVRSAAEITAHIEAIKNYESPEDEGDWRTRITFVADDEFKNPITTEIIHTAMAESLAVFHTPSEYVHQKIYATDYPFASNGEKPAVNDAIVKAINDGTLILNYIGHGSPDVWADEHIFKKSVDLSRLQNDDKQTIVIAGSCSIGFFDDPGQEGMAEILFRQQGGALETVSATRLVYATDNAIFNYDLFDALFGHHFNASEAVYAAKVLHQYTYNYSLIRNDRSYVVFGDPLGKIGMPEYKIDFDVAADSLMTPLKYFAFSGTVNDRDGQPLAVDGTMELTAYDSRILRHHELGLDYTLGGPAIFRGTVAVAGGVFEGGFIVPLDIDYGGDAAHLTGYGIFGNVSGIGGRDSLRIALSAASTDDNNGPDIEYQIEGLPDFVSGNRVPANAVVAITLSDPSGINLTGGLGHRIEVIIDNDNNTTVNLTDLFSYAPGSYQSGQLEFTLPDLSPERHSFKIRAWDNANNPALIEFDATPSPAGRIALQDVMNYPNPMEEGTEFFFNLTESADWVEIDIFTLAGRKIKSFRSDNLPVGRNRLFHWDGRDFDGDRVAEGIYIYKVSAKGRLSASTGSADNMAETFGKLILLN